MSYLDATTDDLKYATKSAGVWTSEMADSSASSVGFYSSIAIDAQGNPHVSYFAQTGGNLRYARKSGGQWLIETADGSANSVGSYTSLALDSSGNPHVSYWDNTTGNLLFARKSGGVWTIETADGSWNNVGGYSALALDAWGNAHVSYLDATAGDLKYANGAIATSVPNAGADAEHLMLSVAPNPASGQGARVSYRLPAGSRGRLAVFDASGRRVATLGESAGALGSDGRGASIAWDARDATGRPVTSGIYFVRLTSGEISQTQRLVLVR